VKPLVHDFLHARVCSYSRSAGCMDSCWTFLIREAQTVFVDLMAMIQT
jgi:hypothetical protein